MKRRIKWVAVSREFLNDLFVGKEVHFKIENPLPEDAKIVQIGYDINRNVIMAFVESETFPEVGEADIPEAYMLTITDLPKEL